VQLGCEAAGIALVDGVLRVGVEKLVGVALARTDDRGLIAALLELVGIHHITLEGDDLGRRLLLDAAHDVPPVHAQVGPVALLDDAGGLRKVGDDLLGVAGIVHQQAEQEPVGRAVADMNRELGLRRGEPPGLDDLGHQVGADLTTRSEHALRPGPHEMVHEIRGRR
jgi:hypothetical protein